MEKASPGIVTIIAYDITGTVSGKGSGFFIDRKGLILTNADIMKDAYSAEVISESNRYNSVATCDFFSRAWIWNFTIIAGLTNRVVDGKPKHGG